MELNKTMIQYFEWYLDNDATLWKKVKESAKDIKAAGITAIWLPPAYKGAKGIEDVGYAVYDLYDLGEFDQKGSVPTKYGTKDEYLEAIKALKDEGIEVLADIVLGHRMGADEQERIFAYGHDEYNRNVEIQGKKKITVWTKFTFPGRNNKYSDFKWNWTHFHGTDYDAKSKETGVYRFIGKEWDSDVDNEFGNFDYLMGVDLDMSDEEVLEELNRWGEWYYEFTGVDGFRLDAVKHIDFSFFKNWLNNLRTKYNRDIFAVGEYWNAELNILLNYIEKTESEISLFDVPLHFNMHYASNSNGMFDMRYILKNTLVSVKPELAVTFVDNHDTQYGQSLESYVLAWFKPHAYSIIMLRNEGYPCAFYGDYMGVSHDNLEPVKELKDIMAVRRDRAYGKQHDYFNHKRIVGWTLEGVDDIKDSGLAVLMTVSRGGKKKMYIGKHFAGCIFIDTLKNIDEEIIIDEEGFGLFKVNPGSVSVYILKDGQNVGKRDTENEFKDENEVSAYEEVGDIPEYDEDEQREIDEKAEQERLEQEKLEQEKAEQEKAEQEKTENGNTEQGNTEQQNINQDNSEQNNTEQQNDGQNNTEQ